MTNVTLYVTDTMADWEYGHLMAGLAWAQEAGADITVRTVGVGGLPVRSKGGLQVLPDAALPDVSPPGTGSPDDEVPDLLVLPGADTWDAGHEQALDLARRTRAAGGTVAAICGATLGLARIGMLDDVRHTSNAAQFLTLAEEYKGGELYEDARAVSDGGVITAGAVFPVDFARAAFEALGAFPDVVTEAWYGLYTTGEIQYFEALDAALADVGDAPE